MTTPMLAGKTAVVTGAARGLGAAIARACIGHGATVILTDVLGPELRATASALGSQATAFVLDVADPAAWDRLAEHLRRTTGRPDLLVNNAGVVRSARLADATHDELMATLAVNVGGTFLGMKMFQALHLQTSCERPGSIVNISSVGGLIGRAEGLTYSASKFGVRGLTKSAAIDLGRLGIRVNAVCPGPIETEMTVGNPQFAAYDWDSYVGRLPIPRIGRPEDVAEAVAWLGSDASAFVTGIDVPVDGGLTATSFGVTRRVGEA